MAPIKFTVEPVEGFPGIQLYTPHQFHDGRGYFEELFSADVLMQEPIKQISHSLSHKNVFRGLHIQPRMRKIIKVLKGKVTVFSVDVLSIVPEFRTHQITMTPESGFLSTTWNYAKGIFAHTDKAEIMYFQDDMVNDGARRIHYSISPELVKFMKKHKNTILSSEDESAPKSLEEITWTV